MSAYKLLKGFSKLSEAEKLRVVVSGLDDPIDASNLLKSFHHPDHAIQQTLSEFSENTLSNFALPFGVAPNFLINEKVYMVPMAIEESSVVAAASSAASFWSTRGGFLAEVPKVEKVGQLHFLFKGDRKSLLQAEADMAEYLKKNLTRLTAKMEARGGGILHIELKDLTKISDHYFQFHVGFNTVDAMGANFINSVLEACASLLRDYFEHTPGLSQDDYEPLMAILSNYTPNCLVRVSVGCKLEEMGVVGGMKADEFARRFIQAVRIAEADVYRATTHNKGIMNGTDAVIIATGNDFRAVEAGVHAYASRSGQYRSLSSAKLENGRFQFSLEMPLAVGTLGGLTRLHPLASLALKILGKPTAKELMMIAAAAGLANNFAAVRSLVTTGIQSGHMRMHLPNIMRQLHATPEEIQQGIDFFAGKKISHQAVESFINSLRKGQSRDNI